MDIIDTDTIKYQYSGPDDSNTFCLSVTSPQSKSKAFHVENGNSVLKGGVCEGHIGPDNEEEEGGEDHPFARAVKSGGPLGLTIRVGKEWNAAEISWTPQEGAKKYELQSRNPTGPNNNGTRYFQYRNINDGSGYCSIGINCTVGIHSHAIPVDTTSLVWTNTSYAVPSLVGQSFEYQMRIRVSGEKTFYSEWSLFVLTH